MKKYQIGFMVFLIVGIILFELVKPDLEQEAISVVEMMIEGCSENDLGKLKETLTDELYTEFLNMSNRNDTQITISRLHVTELFKNEAKVEYEIIVSEPDWEDDTFTGMFQLIRMNKKWVISKIDGN